jgi:hypothetical protein
LAVAKSFLQGKPLIAELSIVVAYLVLERERTDQGITLRQLRRKLIVKGLSVP